MPRSRRNVADATTQSDTSFLAGWMYADLFLALMVVFLATISFVPSYLSGAKNVSNSYSYVKIYQEPLIVVYDNFNAGQIKKDIEWFLKTRNLPNTTDVVYAQIIGGYSKTNEQSTVAIDRALRFSQLLDNANLAALSNVATSLSSSSTLDSGKIAIKFSFAQQVDVQTKP